MTSELTVQASSLSAIASAIRSKTGESGKYSLSQMATKISSLSLGKVVAYSSGWSKITGKTTLTTTGVRVTIPEAGTYSVYWQQYCGYASTNTYTMLYKGTTSIAGTSKAAPVYSGTPSTAYVSSVTLAKNDVLTIYARTSTTSTTRYICAGGLYAIKQ